jgi:hypothetical protein
MTPTLDFMLGATYSLRQAFEQPSTRDAHRRSAHNMRAAGVPSPRTATPASSFPSTPSASA